MRNCGAPNLHRTQKRTCTFSNDQSSKRIDFTLDTWAPRLRWTPLQSIHTNIPRLIEAHSGSARGKDRANDTHKKRVCSPELPITHSLPSFVALAQAPHNRIAARALCRISAACISKAGSTRLNIILPSDKQKASVKRDVVRGAIIIGQHRTYLFCRSLRKCRCLLASPIAVAPVWGQQRKPSYLPSSPVPLLECCDSARSARPPMTRRERQRTKNYHSK